MTNKEIIEDFVVWFLSSEEDMLTKGRFFFQQNETKVLFEEKSIDKFKKYIRQFFNIEDFIEDEFNVKEINNINDFIRKKEITKIILYLNENFRIGYIDKEGELTSHTIILDEDLIINVFNDFYLELHKLNPTIYISCLLLFFNHNLSNLKEQLSNETNRIDQLLITKNIFPFTEKVDLVIHYENIFKKKMLNSLINKPYQFYGFIDENGFSINERVSFKNWIIASNGMQFKNEIDSLSNELVGTDYLVYRYYKYKFYNDNLLESSNEYINNLNTDFQKIKENNSALLIYLNDKGFESDECNTILNVLLNNNFSELNLRSFSFKNYQTEFFRLCHLFYIFDYFKDNKNVTFSEQSDFLCIKIDKKHSGYQANWNNHFHKLMKNLYNKESKNYYPFTTAKKTIRTIEENLKIPERKLKSF